LPADGTPGDDPAAVGENRRRVAGRLRLGDPAGWWWLRQVHGAEVVVAEGPPGPPPCADGAVTRRPGTPLVVLTADCAPLALACDDAVGVVHVGWHGLLAGVVEAAVGRLLSIGTGTVHAALGPCIGHDRYEFGCADLDRVARRLGSTVVAQTHDGRPALDLTAGVRVALAMAGVDELDDVGVCTASSADHFSYRRDGETGRQALVVVLDPGSTPPPTEPS
jgi:YfiH family protein